MCIIELHTEIRETRRMNPWLSNNKIMKSCTQQNMSLHYFFVSLIALLETCSACLFLLTFFFVALFCYLYFHDWLIEASQKRFFFPISSMTFRTSVRSRIKVVTRLNYDRAHHDWQIESWHIVNFPCASCFS